MANQIYLEMKPLKGESKDKNHKDWIILDSFKCGIKAAAPEGRGSGAPNIENLEIEKHIDKSSPKLALAACNRAKFEKAVIRICKVSTSKKNEVILQCTFTNLTCLGYDFNGQDNSTDTTTFKYDKIEWHYTQLDKYSAEKKDNVITRWDRKKNAGG